MKLTHKYFGPWKIALFSALGVALIFGLWGLVEELAGEPHTEEAFRYVIRSVAAAFVATLVFSTWAIRRMSEEREKYEHELEVANRKLRKQAITDGMTGVYNHRYFELKLEKEWQRMKRYGHSLACVMIDLDNFKKINDLCGHQAGDAVLIEVAELLKEELRETDIISRYGGEEFVIIMTEKPSHVAGLRYTMSRIRKSIEDLVVTFRKHRINIKASIGGALAPHDKLKTPEDLVIAADQAMYTAKKAGKNCSRAWNKNG